VTKTSSYNKIAESGLIGKVEFRSDMSDSEVRREICKVFAKPMVKFFLFTISNVLGLVPAHSVSLQCQISLNGMGRKFLHWLNKEE